MKDFAKTFYKSKRWQNARNTYIKMVGGLCEQCFAQGKYTPIEEVHHKIPLTPMNINDPMISLSFDNLIGLCRECHRQMHTNKQTRYTVDELGRVQWK